MKVSRERVCLDLVKPSRLPVGHDLALEETVRTVAGAAIAREGWAKESHSGQILSPSMRVDSLRAQNDRLCKIALLALALSPRGATDVYRSFHAI